MDWRQRQGYAENKHDDSTPESHKKAMSHQDKGTTRLRKMILESILPLLGPEHHTTHT